MKDRDPKLEESISEPFTESRYSEWRRYHHGNVFLALILVFIGAIFLLNNFNILPWSIWNSLWKFWPVILIAWGLQVIFKGSWINYLLIVIITMVIVYFLLTYFNPTLTPVLNQLLPNR